MCGILVKLCKVQYVEYLTQRYNSDTQIYYLHIVLTGLVNATRLNLTAWNVKLGKLYTEERTN